MKIGKKFNELSKQEYIHSIDNYKKYTDFNTLGLYRSITENDKLNLEDKIEIRDYANQTFGKTFNFYQLKDPVTYYNLITLGEELTKGDETHVWNEIRANQEKILKEKQIKHRNFGDYSKHNCGHDDCPMNGIMLKKGSMLSESHMWFDSDKSKVARQEKSKRVKKERNKNYKMVREDLDREF